MCVIRRRKIADRLHLCMYVCGMYRRASWRRGRELRPRRTEKQEQRFSQCRSPRSESQAFSPPTLTVHFSERRVRPVRSDRMLVGPQLWTIAWSAERERPLSRFHTTPLASSSMATLRRELRHGGACRSSLLEVYSFNRCPLDYTAHFLVAFGFATHAPASGSAMWMSMRMCRTSEHPVWAHMCDGGWRQESALLRLHASSTGCGLNCHGSADRHEGT